MPTNFEKEKVEAESVEPTILPPKKSNKKILALLAIVIVAVIIIAVVLVLFMGGDKDKFVGTWTSTFGGSTITFNSDGTVITNSSSLSSSATYDVKDRKLYIYNNDGTVITLNYKFSNNDRTLTLTPKDNNGESADPMVFIKLDGNSMKKNGDINKFVGNWYISSDAGTDIPSGATMIFQSNGDLSIGYMGQNQNIGTWIVESDKLCITGSFTGSNIGKQCISYSFSNSGNTLTLEDPSGLGGNLVLTKQ